MKPLLTKFYWIGIAILIGAICSSFYPGELKPENRFHTLQQALDTLDSPLPKIEPGDWLYSNPEPGQSLSKFQYDYAKPLPKNFTRIYLRPIGTFDSQQRKLLKDIARYLELFYQKEVVTQVSVPISTIPRKYKRKTNGQIQLLTGYVNYQLLFPKKPKDAMAYMAISTADLFPDKQSNFVFGQADQLNKIGVSSIARYDYPDSLHYKKTLNRILKTCTHEIGHMTGLEHCTHARCLMNGSNSLEESDSQPQWLCSECLVKTVWRLEPALVKRDSSLMRFWKNETEMIDYLSKRQKILERFR